MKNKGFLVIIIIILLLFVVWLAKDNDSFMAKISPMLDKISTNVSPSAQEENSPADDSAKTEETTEVADEGQNNPFVDNTEVDEVVCGDNICSEGESENCCQDCGCPAGNYCTDSGECKQNIPFKPIPDIKADEFKFKTDLSSINLMNFKPDFSKIIGLNLGTNNDSEEAQQDESDGIVISPLTSAVHNPHIYGNKVVFSQYYRPGEAKGYIYDITNGEVEAIPYEHEIWNPDIDMKGIVWMDYARDTSEGTDIYYFNPIDNQQGYISPRDVYQGPPRISGRSVAWSEGSQNLYLYWLPSGEEVKVFYPIDQKFLADWDVSNGLLVFSVGDNKENGTYYKVYLYDLSKHSYSIIAETGENSVEHLAIDSNNVVYVAGTKIFVYNLQTKLTRKLEDIYMNGQGIAIYGDKIVYSTRKVGDNLDLFYYNLSTGEEKQLTYNEADDDYPDIYGDFVVYKSGNRKVKLLQIK